MSRRQLQSFRWNGTDWVTASATCNELKSTLSISSQAISMHVQNSPIRVATLNILADCFPWFIEMVIRSNERYEWLSTGIINLNPTIIGLNEVTVTALRQLQKCAFIQANYFITELYNEENFSNSIESKGGVNGLLVNHGCVILSKLPLLEAFAISVCNSTREAVVVKVELGSTSESSAYFCSHHTTAYQTPKNAKLRTQQIRDICNVLQPLGYPFVIMGDLNLHYPFEDAVVIDNNFIDAWAQTHFSRVMPFNDGNQGYTFDAVHNSLVSYYIPGECRQMRLDRILFSHGFPAFAIAPCALWANEPLVSGNYLFPSDHFGLFIDIITVKPNDNMKYMPLEVPDPSAEEILIKNAHNKKNQTAYRLGVFRTTLALVSHTIWLGAFALGFR